MLKVAKLGSKVGIEADVACLIKEMEFRPILGNHTWSQKLGGFLGGGPGRHKGKLMQIFVEKEGVESPTNSGVK